LSRNAVGYYFTFFFAPLPKCRMYVLYQWAIIWVMPFYSMIEKNGATFGEPSDLTFFKMQKVEPFFSPFFLFFDPPLFYEFL
jgi:hypothetical protein